MTSIQKTLKNYSSELQSFRITNGHKIELYILNLIKKQLKDCIITNPYNFTYDLILNYRQYKYNIEVKSAVRWIPYGKDNLRCGYYRFKNSDITNKSIHVFGFCHYWNKFKYAYFVYGKLIRDYFEKKKKTITNVISIDNIRKYFNPKDKIIDILNQIKLYELK